MMNENSLSQPTLRLSSALYCWILEILYCKSKGRRALLRISSTEGRSVCLCWAPSKSEGPKGSLQEKAEGLAGKDAEIARLQARNLENAATLQVLLSHHQL